jgi:RNA polymerase sigma-70 factor (ECF subfamily)
VPIEVPVNATEFAEDLALARAGDEVAFGRIFDRTQPALLRYLRALAPTAADDIASETWLSIVRDLRSFHGDEKAFRAWVLTIGRHRMVDARRADARQLAVPMAELPAPGDAPVAPDTSELVVEQADTRRALALIATLPPDQAEAILLRVVAGLEVAQVADIMGRSPGAVRVLTHRGLRTLAARVVSV